MNIIKPWEFNDSQTITIRDKKYIVHECLRLSKDLEVNSLLLNDMNICYSSPCANTLRSFMEHMRAVEEANLDYPILLNEDGSIIDGKHRVCKAIMEGRSTIEVKRFIKDPEGCFTWA